MATSRRIDLDFIKALAREQGGECLSDTYRGVLAKYDFRCGRCGAEWTASAAGLVYNGSFCKSCSLKKAWSDRKTRIDEVRAFVASKGGTLLSRAYENSKAKLHLECGEGHRWKASYEKLKFGRWCPACGRRQQAAASS